MENQILLRNAGGFERWKNAIIEKAAILLTEDLIDTENDDSPDPCDNIVRPRMLKDNATTQDIALWEARERQYIMVHSRLHQLLGYMVQTVEPNLYERVISSNNFKKRTPTLLYRAIKKALNPSSKSAEVELQTRMAQLEQTAKTSDIDIWLNSWIQIENIAKLHKYTWANEVIDRFHAAISHRSIFFATTFASHIWLNSITLCQLAEQFRLCEAKLKRFDHITPQDMSTVFLPPSSFANHNSKTDKNSENTKKYTSCPCGLSRHQIQNCFLLNIEKRPTNWVDRRSYRQKKKFFDIVSDISKRTNIEKQLNSKIPSELLKNPDEITESSVAISNDLDIHENYITDSENILNDFPCTSYISSLASSQSLLPYRNWWVFDSGSGRHICHQKELFWTLKPIQTSQFITTGGGNCKIEGVGSVILKVNTPNGKGTLKIESVLYVPNFMANIVSMDRIRDQMLIWDHSDNWLTQWDSSRTPVAKIWNQFNQNFIARDAIFPNQMKIMSDIPETVSLDLVLKNSSCLSSSVRKISSADVVVWHRRLGHPAPHTIRKIEDAATGAKVTGSYDGQCEGCLLAKSKRIVSRIPSDVGDDLWCRMHVDLIIFQKAWNGDNYALHAFDAKGCGHIVETLSSKDQATLLQSVSNMIRRLQLEGRKIRYFRSDNEAGFGLTFQKMLKDKGILFEKSVPYTPEQNGYAESSGNRICVVARAIRIHSGLPQNLWPELVRAAVYLLNRTPTKKLNWKTPYEQYNGIKPDISNLKIVGCRAYVNIPRQNRLASEKLAERAWIGYLVGFESLNIWRIWHPTSRQVVRVRDVVFQEDRVFDDDKNLSEVPIKIDQIRDQMTSDTLDLFQPILNRWNYGQIQKSESIEDTVDVMNSLGTKSYNHLAQGVSADSKNSIKDPVDYNIPGNFIPEKPQTMHVSGETPKVNKVSADLDTNHIISGSRLRSERMDTSAAINIEPEDDHGIDFGQPFFSCLASAITSDRFDNKVNRFDENNDVHESKQNKTDPTSWKQMMKHPMKDKFKIAAREEFQGLQNRRAWDVVDMTSVPEKEQIFPMRWVFVTKNDTDGNPAKYKARLVVRGDLDRVSYNRDEIYSHTLSLQHFRSLMAYINYNDMETISFDAVQAFVNAQRDRPIYCYMPEGFRQRGKVLHVRQALYGHRQSPKDWYNCYTAELRKLKFRSINEEKCYWVFEKKVILFFYVDDSIMAFRKEHTEIALSLQEKLCERFPIKKLGERIHFSESR